MKKCNWSILIPTLNEGGTLQELLNGIYSLGLSDFEVLLLDGGSTDDSRDIFLHFKKKYSSIYWLDACGGKSSALRVGFAKANGAHIAFMDADMQYLPSDLPKLIDSMHIGNDLVITKRRLVNGNKKNSSFRRALSLVYSQIVCKKGLSIPFDDPQSGMKAINSNLLKKMNLRSRGWELDTELILQALSLGAKIDEVEIGFYPREHGRTKTSVFGTSSSLFFSALKTRLNKK
ncbi:MAG: glycosyltransferase family 2 protein [Candidatus Micrarchaeia archaeon]